MSAITSTIAEPRTELPAAPDAGPERWPEDKGRELDFRLLRGASVAFRSLLWAVILSFVLPRGLWLLVAWFGGTAFLLFLVFGRGRAHTRARALLDTLWRRCVPRWARARIEKLHLSSWPERVHLRCTSHPDLRGTLADGLWLPLPLRLASWALPPLALAGGLLITLYLAPPSATERRITELRTRAAEAEQRASDTPASKGTVEERGIDLIDGLSNSNEAGDLGNEPPRHGPVVRPNPNPGGKPPTATPPLTTGPGAGLTPTTPGRSPGSRPGSTIYVDPPFPEGGTTTTTSTTTTTQRRERKAWFSGVPLPLGFLAGLVGWGSSTEYRDEVLTTVQKVVDSEPLTESDLARLLRDVPAEGLQDVADRLSTLIKERSADPATREASLKALADALEKRKAGQPTALEQRLADKIVAMAKRTPPAAPAEVVAALRAELPNGKFPGVSAKAAVHLAIADRMGAQLNEYWSLIESEL